MTRQERRYVAAKKARERWIRYHEKPQRWFYPFYTEYSIVIESGKVSYHYDPEPGIYRKWNGSHGRCACGAVRRWIKKNTNIAIRNSKEEIPNGGFYKRFGIH